MAAGELSEVIALVRDGGGGVAVGVLLVMGWRLVTKLIALLAKAEALIDAVIADRPAAAAHRQAEAAHFDAAESHLGAIRKALA